MLLGFLFCGKCPRLLDCLLCCQLGAARVTLSWCRHNSAARVTLPKMRQVGTAGAALPNLLQVWLYSPNLLQVWLVLPHLLQVWLTQDQLGTFLAALPVAPSATLPGILPSAPSAALPAALYLPHKTRTHEAHCVARKTAVFLAPKPLTLAPTRSPRVDYTRPHAQSSAI